MKRSADKLIAYSFYTLFFLVPLAVYPKTSELFEFNKMILTYLITAFIISLWVIRMALSKKYIFKKTPLDTFLIIFFFSQLASTIFSMDFRTSLLGYYSRFHGGLLSTVSYLGLYWAYVSNMDSEKTKKAIKFLFASALIVCAWAIFEHFGRSFSCLIFQDFGTFDVSCWVQDVQNRVFATFGQPNWLAAWIVALIPISWAFALKEKEEENTIKTWAYIVLSVIFLLTLLYTKSRSGILAFFAMAGTFWVFQLIKNVKEKVGQAASVKNLLIFNASALLVIVLAGTPWTPNIMQIIKKAPNTFSDNQQTVVVQGPALEVGGTESGQIRKIVWKGAIDMWLHNPIFGTGVETFAFSYYKYRPVEHNLVSEWNFLYNKAHNEYLNFAGTTGTVGLASYLALIGAIIYFFVKRILIKSGNNSESIFDAALLSGFVSILITNFFGFSVVAVAILFFPLPAMGVSLNEDGSYDKGQNKKQNEISGKLSNSQISIIFIALCSLLFALYSILRYWNADRLFAKGKLENDSGLYAQGRKTLLSATEASSKESVFWSELSESTGAIALYYAENEETETARQIAQTAVSESNKAASLSPKNVVNMKKRANLLANLAGVEPSLMQGATSTLYEASKLAPTDANIFYNLSILYLRTGNSQAFLDTLKKSIDMKLDYKKARLALAQYYISENRQDDARDELEYILKNIAPEDKETEKLLEDMESAKN